MSPDRHPYLELLQTNCGTCGHNKLSHSIVKGVRRACCFGTATVICTCRKFVEPEEAR